MAQRFYPAVLERGENGAFGVWFPDFPSAVSGGRSQEDAMARAHEALADAVQDLGFGGDAMPTPTPMEAIAIPEGCDFATIFSVGVTPPDQSERVNVYLPKALIERIDKAAAELGMNRSSFFGWAITYALRSSVKSYWPMPKGQR